MCTDDSLQTCTHDGQKGTLGIFSAALTLASKAGSPLEPAACALAEFTVAIMSSWLEKPWDSPVSSPGLALRRVSPLLAFTWLLGIQTLLLMFAKQILHPLSHECVFLIKTVLQIKKLKELEFNKYKSLW